MDLNYSGLGYEMKIKKARIVMKIFKKANKEMQKLEKEQLNAIRKTYNIKIKEDIKKDGKQKPNAIRHMGKDVKRRLHPN